MLKSGIIRLFTVILTFLLALTITSCGKYSEFQTMTDSLQIEVSFPEARSGAVTVEETEKDITQQQSALCFAYDKAYKITEPQLYDEYSSININKRLAELSKTRNSINSKSEAEFKDNLQIILRDVTNCPNVFAYINKRIEEVKNFYADFIKLQDYTKDDFDDVTSVFLNFYNSKNEFAKSILREKEELVVECATLSVEKNADATSGHSASLQKNNNIIIALNEFYDGVCVDYAVRISSANKILSSYVKELNAARDEKQSDT